MNHIYESVDVKPESGSSMVDRVGPELLLDIDIPPRRRLLTAAVTFLFWGLGIWMAILLVLQTIVMPNSPPLSRGHLATAIALPLTAAIVWLKHSRRIYRMSIGDDIALYRSRGVERISPASVTAVVGLGGFNIDGGEMVVWSETAILTAQQKYAISFGYEHNPLCYEVLRHVSYSAWGMPFRSELQYPADEAQRSRSDLLATLAKARSAYMRGVWYSALLGIALVLVPVVLVAGLWLTEQFNEDAAKGVANLIIPATVGVFQLGYVAAAVLRLKTFNRTERQLRGEKR